MQSDQTTSPTSTLDHVRSRYARGATETVPELCCPVDYDASLLEVLPREIVDRDYGCGDPSRFVRRGDVVLDLGSGAGKICYMASQIVGSEGRVIGVDATDEMLALARQHVDDVGKRIGWHNVAFHRGHIQDLALDLDRLAAWLSEHPVTDLAGVEALEEQRTALRANEPMIPAESVDVVLSNCVLNLVDPADKPRMFREIHRVLKRGGRAAISDIVSDEDVPESMQRDPELWTGCISGAMREDRFLDAFADAGLYGVEVASYQSEPWAVVEGIEFRSMTVVAHKGKEGACDDHGEAVIYRGPFRAVLDDDGHRFERGVRTAVCRKTYEIMTRAPYADDVIGVGPLVPVDDADVRPFERKGDGRRDPRDTKRGAQLRADVSPGSACCEPSSDGTSCC
ncbi:MAG: methyltransferase domain-containing protein [Planctomycetota bacterium]